MEIFSAEVRQIQQCAASMGPDGLLAGECHFLLVTPADCLNHPYPRWRNLTIEWSNVCANKSIHVHRGVNR